MYIYPENLKAKVALFLWELKDITVTLILGILSVVILVKTGIFIYLVIVLTYTFLTIKYEETSILDFIKYACSFFIQNQTYEWSEVCEKTKIDNRFLFYPGTVNEQDYMNILQLEKNEFDLIKYPKRGCLFKCGNEIYNLVVKVPKFKAKLFGGAGGK